MGGVVGDATLPPQPVVLVAPWHSSGGAAAAPRGFGRHHGHRCGAGTLFSLLHHHSLQDLVEDLVIFHIINTFWTINQKRINNPLSCCIQLA